MVVGSESGHIYVADLESGRSHTGTISSKVTVRDGVRVRVRARARARARARVRVRARARVRLFASCPPTSPYYIISPTVPHLLYHTPTLPHPTPHHPIPD